MTNTYRIGKIIQDEIAKRKREIDRLEKEIKSWENDFKCLFEVNMVVTGG